MLVHNFIWLSVVWIQIQIWIQIGLVGFEIGNRKGKETQNQTQPGSPPSPARTSLPFPVPA